MKNLIPKNELFTILVLCPYFDLVNACVACQLCIFLIKINYNCHVCIELTEYQKRKANWKGHVSCAKSGIMYSCLCFLKVRKTQEVMLNFVSFFIFLKLSPVSKV